MSGWNTTYTSNLKVTWTQEFRTDHIMTAQERKQLHKVSPDYLALAECLMYGSTALAAEAAQNGVPLEVQQVIASLSSSTQESSRRRARYILVEHAPSLDSTCLEQIGRQTPNPKVIQMILQRHDAPASLAMLIANRRHEQLWGDQMEQLTPDAVRVVGAWPEIADSLEAQPLHARHVKRLLDGLASATAELHGWLEVKHPELAGMPTDWIVEALFINREQEEDEDEL